MKKAKLYQIFFDEKSRLLLEPGYIALDNSNNDDSDWYEFSAIRKFLKENELDDDCFYGFFSTKFFKKTGMKFDYVMEEIGKTDPNTEVVLFSSKLRTLALYRNVFVHAESEHPGIGLIAQSFCDTVELNTDVFSMVNHTGNSVYSNYIAARPAYWKKWLNYADLLYDISNSKNTELADDLNKLTLYGDKSISMKVFVQERMHALLLDNNTLVHVPEFSRKFKQYRTMNRAVYYMLDQFKRRYAKTQSTMYIRLFDYVSSAWIWLEEYFRKK